jgi:hypothetical protein
MQRSYLEKLAAIHKLRRQQQQQLKAGLEEQLAAQTPWCSRCGGTSLLPEQSVEVLYISTDHCFPLTVPLLHYKTLTLFSLQRTNLCFGL